MYLKSFPTDGASTSQCKVCYQQKTTSEQARQGKAWFYGVECFKCQFLMCNFIFYFSQIHFSHRQHLKCVNYSCVSSSCIENKLISAQATFHCIFQGGSDACKAWQSSGSKLTVQVWNQSQANSHNACELQSSRGSQIWAEWVGYIFVENMVEKFDF